jgi:hypothetical protein
MCVGNYTHIFYNLENTLYNKTTDTYDSLSSANQQIHIQRKKIHELEAQVALLERVVAEEVEMKYKAWQRTAEVTKKLGKVNT